MSKQALFLVTFLLFFITSINCKGQIDTDKPVSKNQALSGHRSHIVLGKGATIHLSINANLISASDVIMEGDIIGKGKFIIKARRKISIDANNHKITNLIIENPEGVALESPVKITNKLILTEGRLFLNDFNITLTNRFAFIDISKEAAIVFNGSGIVIESTDFPITQNQDKYPKIFPNQFKFIQCNFHKITVINKPYSYHLQYELPLAGVVQTVDPPPRLS